MLHLLRGCPSALRWICRRPTGQELIAMGGRLSEAGRAGAPAVYLDGSASAAVARVTLPATRQARSPASAGLRCERCASVGRFEIGQGPERVAELGVEGFDLFMIRSLLAIWGVE